MESSNLPLPQLIGESEILNEYHIKCLSRQLPPRTQAYSWSLIYCTSQHGFSLKTLYRAMARIEGPILLVIQDTTDSVFGVFSSNPLQRSDLFYGTGETFLFTFYPDFHCFPWTGENLFFIKGGNDSLAFGAGEGNFGLWLDGDFYHGSSKFCHTFGNTRLCPNQDFVVKVLECWGFV